MLFQFTYSRVSKIPFGISKMNVFGSRFIQIPKSKSLPENKLILEINPKLLFPELFPFDNAGTFRAKIY